MEERDDQDLSMTKIMTQSLRADTPLIHSEGMLLALPAESKLLVVFLTTELEKKALARLSAAYQVPGDVLIGSSNKIKPGTTAAIELTTCLSLQ